MTERSRDTGVVDGSPTANVVGLILHSSFVVSAAIIAVKAVALAKEMVVAYYFGTSGALDAYLIAFLLPSLAVNVFGASFQSALIPALVGSMGADGGVDKGRFVSVCFTRYVVALIVLTGVLAVAASLFIDVIGYGHNFSSDQNTAHLMYLLLPVFFFGSLSAFFTALLAAKKKFLVAALVPAATSVITVAFLVLFEGRWGIESLAVGVVIGFAVEAAILFLAVMADGARLRVAWAAMSGRTRDVFRQTRHIAVGAALMSGTTLTDQAIATWLEEGAVSTLSYATRLTAVLLTIAASLSTVSLPYFSEMVASRDWHVLRQTGRRLGGGVILGSTILIAGVVYFSDPIIELMFERGNFTESDTRQVAWVQAVFILHLPFYVLAHLGMRVLYAAKKGDLVIWSSVVIFSANFIGNLAFLHIWGVAGIALATVLSYFVGAVMILYFARRRVG
jgi:putative peptidoglycan lipid II flippase